MQSVPSNNDNEKFPKRSLVKQFSIEEKGGFVWLFFEDPSSRMPINERPPIPYVPEIETEGYQAAYGEYEFNAGFTEVP